MALMRDFYAQQQMHFDEAAARTALEGLAGDPRWGAGWLLTAEEQVAGYLILTVGYSLEFGGRFGLLDEFYVVEAHRGRGVGSTALAFVEEQCRARGLKALRLEVGTENRRAMELYRRSGFAVHERFLMTRWLDPPQL